MRILPPRRIVNIIECHFLGLLLLTQLLVAIRLIVPTLVGLRCRLVSLDIIIIAAPGEGAPDSTGVVPEVVEVLTLGAAVIVLVVTPLALFYHSRERVLQINFISERIINSYWLGR